jgi:hypothetical protein
MTKLKIGMEIQYQGKTGHVFKIFKLQGELGIMWESGGSEIIKIEDYLNQLKENDKKS